MILSNFVAVRSEGSEKRRRASVSAQLELKRNAALRIEPLFAVPFRPLEHYSTTERDDYEV
jgi:hypothetical protein